jgi:hypothetical protein
VSAHPERGWFDPEGPGALIIDTLPPEPAPEELEVIAAAAADELRHEVDVPGDDGAHLRVPGGPLPLPIAELLETIVATDAEPLVAGDPFYPVPEPELTPKRARLAAITRRREAERAAEEELPLTAEQQAEIDAIEAEATRTGKSRVDLLNERRPLGDRRADGGSAHDDARRHAPEPEAAEPAERPWPRPRSVVDPAAAMADVWHTDGIARPGRLVVIAAAEGVGKSYARLEWSIRLATGHGALFNHYRIAKACRVLTFDVENGEEEETRREEEVLARLGLARSDLGDYWSVSLEGLQLIDPADQVYIRAAIERSSPAVVFFDTGSSMVGDEWGAELKAAIRFLRGLARQFGCTVVVLVHLVKPVRAASNGKANRKPPEGSQHGTSLSDVMGQWTRQADTVAMMASTGGDRVVWTVRKRAPHSQVVLRAEGGTFDIVQVLAGEDLGVGIMERIHGCIATGYADTASIAAYLEIAERTVFRHLAKLRKAGRVAPDAPLRLSEVVSALVSAGPSEGARPVAAPVSDMSVEPTDSVSPPIGGTT